MGFTDTQLKTLKPEKNPKRIMERASDPGFGVQILPSGTKTFVQRYRHGGKEQWYRIGKYPDISLALARKKSRELRELVEAGTDPREYFREQELERREAGTVQDLADEYLRWCKRRGNRSVDEKERAISKDVLPVIGKMKARDVKPADIVAVLRRVHARGSHVQANRLRAALYTMFQVGLQAENDPRANVTLRFGLQWNPASAVASDDTVENVGDRVLTWEELREIWNSPVIPWVHRMGLRMIIACAGPRVGEVMRSSLDEWDLEAGIWTLPPERAKNGRYHLLPITDLMCEIHGEITAAFPDSYWLFPGRNSPKALNPWTSRALGHRIRLLIEGSAKRKIEPKLRMRKWVPEDMRRTAKTLMGEIGVPKHTRDRIQNHVDSGVSSKHYDRYDYIPEKREGLEAWERALRKRVIGL